MTPLYLDPLFWSAGCFLAMTFVCLWWTNPARKARRRQERLHRLSREVHPGFNRSERRALRSRRWPR